MHIDRVAAAIAAVRAGDMPLCLLCDLAEEMGVHSDAIRCHRISGHPYTCHLTSGTSRPARECGLVYAIAQHLGVTEDELIK